MLTRRDGAIGGVLAGEVTAIEIDLGDGEPRRVVTSAGDAYTGRYAGRVRFVLAEVPGARRIRRATGIAADGRRLRGFVVPAPRVERLRRVGGLRAVRYTLAPFGQQLTCLMDALAALCPDDGDATTAAALVTCRPRRTIVLGALPRGERMPTVVLADGRRVRARTLRAGGLRLWLAVVPGGDGVRAIRPDQPLRLPPANDQCGYAAFEATQSSAVL